MQIKALASVIALATAMAFTGSASAQTVFNGVEVSAEDLPALQARCDELANTVATESIADTSAESDADSAGAADATTTDTPQVSASAQATTTLDLDTVDLEACKTAGLTTAM